MKHRIDEGCCVDPKDVNLVHWFTQTKEDGFEAWVRIERYGGLNDCHVKAAGPLATLAEAEQVARARAEVIINNLLAAQGTPAI